MPEISRFLGIVIYMYHDEHNPPHFHAEYGEYEVVINIKTGVARGEFPKSALKKLLEWNNLHKHELLED